MKIAYLLEPGVPLQASRYKYLELLKRSFDVQLFRNNSAGIKALKVFGPDLTVIFGDKYKTYKTCIAHKLPYVLAEHDVVTLRKQSRVKLAKKLKSESGMVKNAKKIIFTSEDHRDYICRTHGYPLERTIIIHLRPFLKDINFEPLPRLPGKTLVYSGGLKKWSKRSSKAGYRAYYGYFKAFIRAGWKVYIYTARKDRVPAECLRIGCIDKKKIPQGQLYRELSQYTAGLQAYNKTGVPKKSFKYCMACRPNKLWEYLGAGIPTIGFNGGRGMRIYNGKWGVILKGLSPEDINSLKLPVITDEMRKAEVMDNDVDRIKQWLLS